MTQRAQYILTALLEIVIIGFLLGWLIDAWFGGGAPAYIIGYIIWSIVLFFTPAINWFFINVPENHGGVIQNQFRTYEEPLNDAELTKLQPTDSLREVGPGLQGVLLWEKLRWIVDMNKDIPLSEPIIGYSKDNIELVVNWQVMLTPLRTYLINTVRYSDDSIKKHFDGKFRERGIELLRERDAKDIAGDTSGHLNATALKDLKEKFNKIFNGVGDLHPEEKEFGTFTGDPQILRISYSPAYQKALEAQRIAENTASAVEKLRGVGIDRISGNAALIGVLASQGLSTEGLQDWGLRANLTGLENAETVIIGSPGFIPTTSGTTTSGKSDKDKGKGGKRKK